MYYMYVYAPIFRLLLKVAVNGTHQRVNVFDFTPLRNPNGFRFGSNFLFETRKVSGLV